MAERAIGAVVTARGSSGAQEERRSSGPSIVSNAFRRHPRWMGALAVVGAAIIILAIGGYFLGWTWTGFKGNTFWDWLSLLITPVTIAVVSTMFSYQQSQWSMIANERKRQEEALHAYFEHITHLLLERGLLETSPDSPIRAVARAHTVATLRQLSQEHRASMLRFLDEAGLTCGEAPVLELTVADLESPPAVSLA